MVDGVAADLQKDRHLQNGAARLSRRRKHVKPSAPAMAPQKTAEAKGPEEVPDKSQNDQAGEDARHPNEEGSHLTFAPLFAS
jgi:hypothetical protein